MRSSVMSVTFCVGGGKQPPHAEAWRSPAIPSAETAAATPRASLDRFMKGPPLLRLLRPDQSFDCDLRRRTRIARPTKRPSTPARAPKATPGAVLPGAAVAQSSPPDVLDRCPDGPAPFWMPPPDAEPPDDAPPSMLACACAGVPVPTWVHPL